MMTPGKRLLIAALPAIAALATLLPPGVQAQAAAPGAPVAVALPDFTDLVERVGPVVVNIRTVARVGGASAPGGGGGGNMPELDENDPFNEFFRRFFPQPGPQQRPGPGAGPRGPRAEREVPRGVGSGFILSADGFVMTNAHVVQGADDIIVTLTDRREFKAKLIGADRRTDVAILKIEASGMPFVRIGDSNRLRVGEWVIAIGSPFGLDNTVTAGIVSAKARETGEFLPFIQTDVAVNPGNSGGPLINMRGEVVGINSQIFTTSGAYAGISFAIPIDEAMRVGDQLRSSGRVTRGRIGVQIGPVTREVAEGIGLAKPQGALVSRVEAGTPAEKAGVEAGDVILKFDGKPIDRESDLPRLVGATKPGSKVTIQVWRKGKAVDLPITVAEMEPDAPARRPDQPQRNGPVANALGLTVSDVPADRLKEMRLRSAIQVDAVDGAAARVGLRQGDLIVALNNVEVANAKQFNDAVSKLDPKRNVVLLVRRGEQSNFIVIRPQDRQ
ncbi:MAG: DegQ family serine endoprotease [Burkholderiaceae bacterium]|nr:DegQ family serine endoprotease [Burkholderiaceae bacterium]